MATLSVASLFALACCFLASVEGLMPTSLLIADGLLTMQNGFTKMVFDLNNPMISSLQGDFEGLGAFGSNVLAGGGYVLELELDSGEVFRSSDGALPGGVGVTVLSNTSSTVSVRLTNIVDSYKSPNANDTWTFSLDTEERGLSFSSSGSMLRAVSGVRAVRHTASLLPRSLYAWFEEGVVQMMNAPPGSDFFGSNASLSRFYAVGGNFSLDVSFGPSSGGMAEVVLMSSSSGNPYWSGYQAVLAGSFARFDAWNGGWLGVPGTTIAASTAWTLNAVFYPSPFDCPVGTLSPSAANLPTDELRAFLTGIYPSIVGNLNTYPGEVQPGVQVAQIATSIHAPQPAYTGLYNFFDPDNYIGLTAMMYSGDAYLLEQARIVLERSGDFLTSEGQLPHHFVGIEPTYEAISGAIQTGPNLFWTLTALRYAKESGNATFLSSYMTNLRKSASFLLNLYEPSVGLLSAPGSLMIDVFIRNNYTADSNAMMVFFLKEFAEAELAMGNVTGYNTFLNLAGTIATAMNSHLWDAASNDHYVTQMNPDGSTRDFVDYDANLIAVASGVAGSRAEAVLGRVDAGRCTHGRATFVSEIYYGPSDCYNGNVGDSWCSMGRIGMFDALARKATGDLDTFENVILEPLLSDLLEYTWIYERYGCDGLQQLNRSHYYFEYPAVVSILLREVKYGIDIGLNNISISPFGVGTFAFHVGLVNVDYSSSSVTLTLPGYGSKNYQISGLQPNAKYTITSSPASQCSAPTAASTDAQGNLVFRASTGSACTVQVVLS